MSSFTGKTRDYYGELIVQNRDFSLWITFDIVSRLIVILPRSAGDGVLCKKSPFLRERTAFLRGSQKRGPDREPKSMT